MWPDSRDWLTNLAKVKGGFVRAQNVLTMEGVSASYKVHLFEVIQGWDLAEWGSSAHKLHTNLTQQSVSTVTQLNHNPNMHFTPALCKCVHHPDTLCPRCWEGPGGLKPLKPTALFKLPSLSIFYIPCWAEPGLHSPCWSRELRKTGILSLVAVLCSWRK